jgi:prepilin-type N-terminal cleavage/methylation domain-containing protein
MKNKSHASRNGCRGFTLVELLVVIAIIGILAALLVPTALIMMRRGKIAKAKNQIVDLVGAINRYEAAYSRYPTSLAAGTNDFTYAGKALEGGNPAPPSLWQQDNSEVIAILMDVDKYPGTGLATTNAGHVKNPQQVKFLNANMVSDPTLPGVGPDLIYRDPWGSPYIITMDLNYNGRCKDVFYRYRAVSQKNTGQALGFNGLFNNADPTGASDDYEFNGGVMVWSLGLDSKADFSNSATAGYNKDNILSWK